jgi:ribonuclease HI
MAARFNASTVLLMSTIPSLHLPTSPLVLATDGSALGNPGPAGWCWYINDQNWQAGGILHGTNNQGELTAVHRALSATRSVTRPLVIECDSKYAISALTLWYRGWERNGWKNSAGAPVANRELIEETLGLLSGRKVTFTWVRGHNGHPRNEAADLRARDGAVSARSGRSLVSGPGLNL